MSEKGISKYWTPGQEIFWEQVLGKGRTFAEKHLLLLLRDLLKYDGRSRESKKRFAQARLRLITASDQELEEMAKIICHMPTKDKPLTFLEELGKLKQVQAIIREKGIKRSELECL